MFVAKALMPAKRFVCLLVTGVFTRAGPGDYSPYSTGEVVTNSDFVTTWSVTAAIKN